MGFKIDQLADSMPPMQICRENILCYVTDKEDALRNAQWFGQECLANIVYFTDWYKDPGERFAVKRAVLDMVRNFFPDKDYDTQWYHRLSQLYVECAFGELTRGDPDAALSLLKELLTHLEDFHRRADNVTEYPRTSVSTYRLPPYTLRPFRLIAECRGQIISLIETSDAFPQIADSERYLRFRKRLDELAEAQP